MDQYPDEADFDPAPRPIEYERLSASVLGAPHTPLYGGTRYYLSLAALAEMSRAERVPEEFEFTCKIGLDDETDSPHLPEFRLTFSPVSYGLGY